ncbi:MAG: DUF1028 domain-containing protein [Phycisphaerales bacterium]|nr:DUF1028 domain-containing protein [Phycisphaerales bacterium]
MLRPLLVPLIASVIALCPPTSVATWSICIADTETREVAVGTVTCLTGVDLLGAVPVVVVGEGAAASQAAIDGDGARRLVMFEGLMDQLPLAEIFTQLEPLPGHAQRQYGIADVRGETLTFSGDSTLAWAGGVTGADGTMVYAIQGNILVGPCVVDAIEDALLTTPGDMAEKLMAGMAAARAAGGDGRCACLTGTPTSCGCPPDDFDKSGHVGGVIVARVGDVDDSGCTGQGCADGTYFLRLNVPTAAVTDPDPVVQLRTQFAAWRAMLTGRADAIQSTVAFTPAHLPADGVSEGVMTIALRDWRGLGITTPVVSVDVTHAAGSVGSSSIGAITDVGGGLYEVRLTAGRVQGVDRFRIAVDDGIDLPIVLAPFPAVPLRAPADLDGDGDVDFTDLLQVLATWGVCPAPPATCLADIDRDGVVGFTDLLAVLSTWRAPGACCLPDGSCAPSAVGGEACVAAGGVYQGDSTGCGSVDCPQPGACCLADGACVVGDVGGATCVATGGRYQGDDTTCGDARCLPEACCLPDGTCVPQFDTACRARGGVPQGVDTVCATVACPQPGACCRPDGSCTAAAVIGGGGCIATGGVYIGDDTDCALVDCPPLGACCFTDGTCGARTETGCVFVGGQYGGDDVACAAVECPGACCLSSGGCFFVDPAACRDAGGVFQSGVACGGASCPAFGGCCLPGEPCTLRSQDACDAAGGHYLGDDTTCGAVDCTRGACCLPDGRCFTVAPAVCDVLGGEYRGDGTSCDVEGCP